MPYGPLKNKYYTEAELEAIRRESLPQLQAFYKEYARIWASVTDPIVWYTCYQNSMTQALGESIP